MAEPGDDGPEPEPEVYVGAAARESRSDAERNDPFSLRQRTPSAANDVEHLLGTNRVEHVGEDVVRQAIMADDLTDAKIAASEARMDAKLAVFQGQFDRVSDKLDSIAVAASTGRAEQRAEATANRTAVITTVLTVGFALGALLVAVAAYGDSVFSRGMSVRDVVDKAVQEIQGKQLPPSK